MLPVYPAAAAHVLSVDDPAGPGPFRCTLLYPTLAEPAPQSFGHYSLPLAMAAPPAAASLPVVLISHGNGGSPWTHRDLALELARHGWLVVLPEHAGNCVGNNTLAGRFENLVNRPRQIRLALDAAVANPIPGLHANLQRLAVIGHSLGGYSALAAAGGRPIAGPHESPDGQPRAVPVTADTRIRQLVLLAPAAARFAAPQALAALQQPILLWAAELDTLTPPAEAELVQRQTAPGQTQLELIPGAGHFSFLSPFPPILDRPGFAPAQDPPGFDRRALQPRLHQAVLQFLRTSAVV